MRAASDWSFIDQTSSPTALKASRFQLFSQLQICIRSALYLHCEGNLAQFCAILSK